MDLNELKKLITDEGGKIIIIENDRPVFVMMSYEEYKGKKRPVAQPAIAEQKQEISQSATSQELTLDDLPL